MRNRIRSRSGKSQLTKHYRLKTEECQLSFWEMLRADLGSVSRFEARADETAAGGAAAVVVVGAVAIQNPGR